jgi:hypothetical protein
MQGVGWQSAYRQNDDARASVNAVRLCTRSCMRWLVAFLIVAAPLLARDKREVRDWQEGTVQSVQLKHMTAFDPHAAEVDLEIATNKIIYKVTLAYSIHKVDLIPGVGIATEEGWLIDDQGIERKLIVRSASVLPRP